MRKKKQKKPQQPQQQRSFWSRRAGRILGLALFVLAVHDVFGSHGLLATRRALSQVRELRGQIDRLNRENSDLSKQVHALRTDPKAIERIAREEMGLARPGEMIFKLPDESQKPDAPSKKP